MMMITTRSYPKALGLLLALVASAAVLLAPAPALGAMIQAEPDVEKAEKLEARAEALMDDTRNWRKAASLLRKAADYREDSDARKVTNYLGAARLAHYGGDVTGAQKDMVSAAQLALRQGDVLQASHAYLDAAWLAKQARDAKRAQHFMEEARLLANSPLLAQADRAGILNRIEGPA
jgi:uncharacterized protein HemY